MSLSFSKDSTVRDPPMLALESYKSAVTALAFSPDSGLLLTGSRKEGVRLWDESGEKVAEFPLGSLGPCHAVAWSPEGDSFAFADGRQFVTVRTGEPDFNATELAPKDSEVSGLAYLSDDLLAVGTGSRNLPAPGSVQLWDIPRKMIRPQIFREEQGVRALIAHPSTKSIAWIGGSDLSVWPITKPDRQKFLGRHSVVNGKYVSMAFSSDGDLLAAGLDWSFTLYQLRTGKVIRTVRQHKGQVAAIAFSPDRRTLATGSWDETVRLWDLESGLEKACLNWKIGKITTLAYSPDGTRLAAGTLTGSILIWDAD